MKTEKETNADGKVTTYKKYPYDSVGNVTETIDYVAGTKGGKHLLHRRSLPG